MSEGGQRVRTASYRLVVEAAIDFSKEANRRTWEGYRSSMSDSVSPWREGGFYAEEAASSQFDTSRSRGSDPI
jgi:hypothetical protein